MTARMVETCTDCGKTWGVTMTPREVVKCGDCSRPRPWRNPELYWWLRAYATSWPPVVMWGPQWWDQQCSRADLRHAAEFAKAAS